MMEEELDLPQVCEKLDALLLRHLDLVQEYVDLSLKGEVHQKDGYFNLAKTRYVSGGGTGRMTRVCLPTENSLEEYEAVGKVIMDEGKVSLTFTEDGSKHSKLLKQFGALPPPSVRVAQKSFQTSLALLVDRANVLRELSRVRQQFISLQNLKYQLHSVAES